MKLVTEEELTGALTFFDYVLMCLWVVLAGGSIGVVLWIAFALGVGPG